MKKMNHLLGFMVLGLALSVTSCGKSFTITFDTNDGSTIAAITVDGKGTVGTVEAPTKEGHNFAGWFLDEAFTQEVDLATYVPTGDVTLYAKWTLESFDVKFEENGGTDVQDIVADYGTPITLPEAPTKEGYDFVKWYLDEELITPYANQPVKEDTTLYAKWRSGLVYTGTEIGEADYNPEDGTYSFSVSLPLWGRFSLMYYGNLISAADENLVITGLYNDTNAADWTRNLYCAAPEEGGEIDYTTFLCCKAGIYDVTFNPETNTLDIQDGNPPIVIPETGFCYLYTNEGNDLVYPTTVELDEETNTYAFEVELAAWRYVEMHYNGEIIDSADENVELALNTNGGNIYIGGSPDPTTSFYTSVANKYRFEYTPATETTKAKVTTSLVIEIPETGVYYMYVNPDNVLQAPKEATYDEATDSYSFEVGLAQWRYFTLYKDGQAVPYTDLTISGDGWVDGTYDNSGNGSLYIDGDATHFLRSQKEVATYKVVYSATNNTLEIDNLDLKPAPTIPETGVYFVYDIAKDGVSVQVVPEASEITEENGVYSFTIGLGQWRYVSVYKDGQPLKVADMTVSGDGWVDGTYDKSTNGSLYVPEDVTRLMRSQGGVVDYTLSYNPTDNTLVIDNLSLSDVPSAEVEIPVLSTGNNDSATMVLGTSGETVCTSQGGTSYSFSNGWRLYVVVDGDGKIAYMVYSPLTGYGNPYSTAYVRHSDYATYTSNPAFTNLSEPLENQWGLYVNYDVVIPEGGFAICAHGGEANAIVQAIMGVDATVDINVNTYNVDSVRLAYDAANAKVVITK